MNLPLVIMMRNNEFELAAEQYAEAEPRAPFYDEDDIYDKVRRAFLAGANYVLSNQSVATMAECSSEGPGWSSSSRRYTKEE